VVDLSDRKLFFLPQKKKGGKEERGKGGKEGETYLPFPCANLTYNPLKGRKGKGEKRGRGKGEGKGEGEISKPSFFLSSQREKRRRRGGEGKKGEEEEIGERETWRLYLQNYVF